MTVHDYGWDLPDAAVVCREIGCGAEVGAPRGAHFGQGSGPIVTLEVKCSGREAALRECESRPWGDYPVPHSNDAGVICEDHRMPRLVPKDDQCSGRLEVQYGETWETVCDLDWDMDNADVVCSQLHCGVAVSVPRGAYFGKGTGLVHNDVFECKGNHGPRLVGGKDRCSGRVEVLHGDEWGTVCDQYFSLLDAGVVCEQLQCGAVNETPGGADFGRGSGPVWKENYHCRGDESRLADCPVLPRDQMSCSHSNDAGLICSDEGWSLRLINGSSRCDGRVEIYHNGRWGRVQDRAWNIHDSNVVCRELGCGYAIFAYNSSRYGEGELPAWVNNVQCEGNESQLQMCSTFTLNPISNDSTGVGVLCSDHLQLRMAGGGSTCAGRVEIYYRGSWGTVCDDSWDLVDANVVCRQLGCGYAVEDKIPGFCGRANGQIWLDEVRCSGNESYLWNCSSAPWGRHDCSHKEDVTVKCSEHKEMRLVNGERRCEGRVEVWHNGTWGTVCSEKLERQDAEVICKQMKCGPLVFIDYIAKKYGEGSGPIWMDEMKCSSHESALWQCQYDPWGQHNCGHNEDAGVSCGDAEMPETSSGKGCDGGNESKSRRLPAMRPCISACEQSVFQRALASFPKLFPRYFDIRFGPASCTHGTEYRVKYRFDRKCPCPHTSSFIYYHLTDFHYCTDAKPLLSNSRAPSWGTVCDDSWDLADANVVCRQLGCGSARRTPEAAAIGPASGEIWLDEVKCTGAESLLTSCMSSPLGQHDCDHKEDVFVTCSRILISKLENKPPSVAVVVCATLGILLVVEFVTLVIITCRQSAKRAAVMRGKGSTFGFYEAIYEEIEDILPGKNFSQTDDSGVYLHSTVALQR
ncbi:scavenger receptor cysteine-rich domain-containing protein DMBT1-like [Rhinoraja longicauda]